MRWVGSQVWQQAKHQAASAAAPSTDSDDPPTHQPTGKIEKQVCYLAVLCESKRLFDAVADSLGRQKRIEGDRFTTCTGVLTGKRIVVARPTADTLEPQRFVAAIVDGHHPLLALSAAEGASLTEDLPPGELVVATRVLGSSGESLRLDGSAPPLNGFRVGDIASPHPSSDTAVTTASSTPIVIDHWSWHAAVACQQAELAMMAISVVVTPANRSHEVIALERQKSTAGQAGVLAGMLWKKRSGLGDLWREKEAGWEACNRLAKLVALLTQSAQDEAPQTKADERM